MAICAQSNISLVAAYGVVEPFRTHLCAVPPSQTYHKDKRSHNTTPFTLHNS